MDNETKQRQKAQLRRLIGFQFKQHPSLNLPEEHLCSIERQLALPTRANRKSP